MDLCLLLVNTCYFEIPPFLAEGLSLDTPFHLGSIVNTTMEPGIDAATVPKKRVGSRREELLKRNNIKILTWALFGTHALNDYNHCRSRLHANFL
jgi:hypothetical protein